MSDDEEEEGSLLSRGAATPSSAGAQPAAPSPTDLGMHDKVKWAAEVGKTGVALLPGAARGDSSDMEGQAVQRETPHHGQLPAGL